MDKRGDGRLKKPGVKLGLMIAKTKLETDPIRSEFFEHS